MRGGEGGKGPLEGSDGVWTSLRVGENDHGLQMSGAVS